MCVFVSGWHAPRPTPLPTHKTHNREDAARTAAHTSLFVFVCLLCFSLPSLLSACPPVCTLAGGGRRSDSPPARPPACLPIYKLIASIDPMYKPIYNRGEAGASIPSIDPPSISGASIPAIDQDRGLTQPPPPSQSQSQNPTHLDVKDAQPQPFKAQGIRLLRRLEPVVDHRRHGCSCSS